MRLTDTTAVVTGAGDGIGAAIARGFAAEGADVVVVDIDAAAAQRTAATLPAPGSGRPATVDVSRPDAVGSLVRDLLNEVGSIDVLVNNAGVTRRIRFLELSEPDWDEITGVNAKGAVFFIQAVAGPMIEAGGGAIINIASIAGKGWPRTSNVAYAASKGAMLTATRTLAAELAPHGVRINAICPGLTETPLLVSLTREAATAGGIDYEVAWDRLEELIPLRRMNTPDDIARAAVFLASDDARNITGQSLNVDGGLVWD